MRLIDQISPYIQTVAWPVIVYIVWDLKHNHLAHIYKELQNISNRMSRQEGREDERDRLAG